MASASRGASPPASTSARRRGGGDSVSARVGYVWPTAQDAVMRRATAVRAATRCSLRGRAPSAAAAGSGGGASASGTVLSSAIAPNAREERTEGRWRGRRARCREQRRCRRGKRRLGALPEVTFTCVREGPACHHLPACCWAVPPAGHASLALPTRCTRWQARVRELRSTRSCGCGRRASAAAAAPGLPVAARRHKPRSPRSRARRPLASWSSARATKHRQPAARCVSERVPPYSLPRPCPCAPLQTGRVCSVARPAPARYSGALRA